MLQEERLTKITELLSEKNTLTNQTLCKALFISISTLRRDLIELEKRGILKRSHGGATLVSQTNNEFSFLLRAHENQKEKSHIANLAQSFIKEHQALFLDSSTTTTALCSHFKDKNLIVVTNGIQNIIGLSQLANIQLYALGGQVKMGSLATVGDMAGQFTYNFKADIAFISCRGLSSHGLFEADSSQGFVKQQMIRNAKKVIVLCDHTKFYSEHFFKSATWNQIDILITNKKPADEFIEKLTSWGCCVIWE